MNKLIRITTVPLSLSKLLRGQMRFMSLHYDVAAVSSGGKTLQEVSDYEGVPVIAVEMTREITLFKDILSLLKMTAFLRKEKPLIVHTHTPKAGIVGMFAAWLARVPVRLHTVAGLPLVEAVGVKRKLLNFVEKLTYAFATNVYPNSKGLEEIILENKFCKKDKLKVIANGSSNGIDTSFFDSVLFSEKEKQALRTKLGIAPGDFVFIFIGRMVRDKGIEELIKAFQKLSDENPRVKLVLVGDYEKKLDPLTAETENTIENHPAIRFVGYQKDVRPYLAISNVFVFPSYREGFPNVVMQAGAMGLPSIVTDINGCNEIIIEKENGIIIPPKDESSLLESMKYFADKPDEVKKMVNQARPLIASRYEQRVVWDALLEEYRRLEKEYTEKK